MTDSSSNSLSTSGTTNLRGQRYCEVFVVTQENGRYVANVFNTIGVNDCPESCSSMLTSEYLIQNACNAGFSAVYGAYLNGPRYWAMDSIQSASSQQQPVVNIGCFSGRYVASYPTPSPSETSPAPYTERPIFRNTVYTFQGDKPMYFLSNPEGEWYIMQSSTSASLPPKPTLPAGWSFISGTCQQDLLLTAPGQTVVLQDNLANTYQKLAASQTNYNPKGCINQDNGDGFSGWRTFLWVLLVLALIALGIWLLLLALKNGKMTKAAVFPGGTRPIPPAVCNPCTAEG
jgi:hypothetical protein